MKVNLRNIKKSHLITRRALAFSIENGVSFFSSNIFEMGIIFASIDHSFRHQFIVRG
ncbi:hypothetical protein MCW_00905 [Cardidatus Bartonella washoeensis 085-0475]|uniref:Uncharacterized protein n=1 Tax=Cardidatus Bartonella washoeensis 085-0475 TaxID=1094564 RepID=J0QPT1_9HYPH|nr:hypothetical protein MCW_00905 [Bartonella washoeensis 085-0475]